MLKNSLNYFEKLNGAEKERFRFIQISTDEVYGSLKKNGPQSIEESPYFPNSPYSASKASGDHLVRAWHETYGLPTITTNCTNNYGPFQHKEKLIPLLIHNCLENKQLPIYGDGLNIRDWLFVEDHCDALTVVLEKGINGETYNIGGKNEIKNIEVVKKVCDLMDELRPKKDGNSYHELITFVDDRAGHDFRYARCLFSCAPPSSSYILRLYNPERETNLCGEKKRLETISLFFSQNRSLYNYDSSKKEE